MDILVPEGTSVIYNEPKKHPNVKMAAEDEDISDKMWALMDIYRPHDIHSIQQNIVNHIEYTLATPRFDIDENFVFQGTALSVRDHLLEALNDGQIYFRAHNSRRISYLSIEFLLGRLLQNALVSIELEQNYKEALADFGYKIEEIYDNENDPALGNGGLGRLAACYIDSMATCNIPAWGYGIRYDYGIFKQLIENYEQKELPDYWLTKGNPWEIMRLDTKFTIKFFGYCKNVDKGGKKKRVWEGGDEVIAVAYDTAVPGFKTFNCIALRLWKSFPSEEFDFDSFNKGDYQSALEDKNYASFITSVLYPNDSTLSGKELRLKQEYFFSAATIHNLVRRFKRYHLPWSDFPKTNCIQLNDTHPTIAILELLRLLMDDYDLDFQPAFKIVRETFNYTNHTVLPEALEKWGVDLFQRILPRHLELVYLINYHFLEELKSLAPGEHYLEKSLSIIEESYPKQIRMANLCVISSSHVNGVARIHSGLLKTTLFRDFHKIWPDKFTNVTNGVTPRRWIHCAFPELSKLYTDFYGSDEWLLHLEKLKGLYDKLDSTKKKEFVKRYKEAKLAAKIRMKKLIKDLTKIDIDESFMYDIIVKRIHEYKRQFMDLCYCIYRYLQIKHSSPGDRKKFVKRVSFFGGKAAPGYAVAKNIIKLINLVGDCINKDPDVNPYFKVIFIPDYKVSVAQIVIPSADINQQISTAGTEASGTSCMKFVMTGSRILGTRDGANIEIAEEIGEENVFFFGKVVDEVEPIRQELRNGKTGYVGQKLQKAFEVILENRCGDSSFMHQYVHGLINGGDYYLLCHDFDAYVEAQEKVDKEYADVDTWVVKCINSITRMGFFSSDRSIRDYAENIWHIQPVEVPKPASRKDEHMLQNN